MTGKAAPQVPVLAAVPLPDLRQSLAGNGLWIDVGAAVIRVQSDSVALAAQLQAVYGSFPFVYEADWADLHVHLRRPRNARRWFRPQVGFRCDGVQPFEPYHADRPLPLFEWGCNWLIGRRLSDLLLLHAGAVERDGLALLLPALPGSGKSTLTAALSQRGWRLLSDEFGAFDPDRGSFRAVLKPVALKNQSIEVIRRFAPRAVLGPEFANTRKGTVAHLAPHPDAVERRHEPARPGAVVLPKWEAGSSTRFEPLPENVVFPALAFNAFNYNLLGAVGFQAATGLVRQCPAWQLVYSDLDDALSTLEAAWPHVVERHRAAGA
ncbi:MAG: HprK-related kinase A [Burkholderiaceae bacterium]|nr:HprK-related kinase A [Burkholderiaceae bacterium]